MKKILVSFVFLISIGAIALSQNVGVKTSPCDGTETQASANAYARYKFTQADVEMKAVYQQLIAELAGEVDKDQHRLTQAQLLWIQYRDANCESEASIYDGGSIRPAVYNTCMASMTEERAKRMRAFLATTRQ